MLFLPLFLLILFNCVGQIPQYFIFVPFNLMARFDAVFCFKFDVWSLCFRNGKVRNLKVEVDALRHKY